MSSDRLNNYKQLVNGIRHKHGVLFYTGVGLLTAGVVGGVVTGVTFLVLFLMKKQRASSLTSSSSVHHAMTEHATRRIRANSAIPVQFATTDGQKPANIPQFLPLGDESEMASL